MLKAIIIFFVIVSLYSCQKNDNKDNIMTKEIQNKIVEWYDKRDEVKKGNPELFSATSAIFIKHDPIGISFGANTEIYGFATGTVISRLPACKSVEELQNVIYEELSRWFGANKAGREEDYMVIAEEIWKIWLLHKEKGAG